MAIISRAAGVILLLLGLVLPSGNARGAEPSYDDYVGGSAFDRMEVKKRVSDEIVTLYFNVDRPLQSKSPQTKP